MKRPSPFRTAVATALVKLREGKPVFANLSGGPLATIHDVPTHSQTRTEARGRHKLLGLFASAILVSLFTMGDGCPSGSSSGGSSYSSNPSDSVDGYSSPSQEDPNYARLRDQNRRNDQEREDAEAAAQREQALRDQDARRSEALDEDAARRNQQFEEDAARRNEEMNRAADERSREPGAFSQGN